MYVHVPCKLAELSELTSEIGSSVYRYDSSDTGRKSGADEVERSFNGEYDRREWNLIFNIWRIYVVHAGGYVIYYIKK